MDYPNYCDFKKKYRSTSTGRSGDEAVRGFLIKTTFLSSTSSLYFFKLNWCDSSPYPASLSFNSGSSILKIWLINSLTLPSSVNCPKTVSHPISENDFRDTNYQMSHYQNQKWIIWEHYTLLRIKTENSRKINIQRKLISGTFLGLSPFGQKSKK